MSLSIGLLLLALITTCLWWVVTHQEYYDKPEPILRTDALTAFLQYPHHRLLRVVDDAVYFVMFTTGGLSLAQQLSHLQPHDTLRVHAAQPICRHIFERLMSVRQPAPPAFRFVDAEEAEEAATVRLHFATQPPMWETASALKLKGFMPCDYLSDPAYRKPVISFLFPTARLSIISLPTGHHSALCADVVHLLRPATSSSSADAHDAPASYLSAFFPEPFASDPASDGRVTLKIDTDVASELIEQVRTVYKRLRVRRAAHPDLAFVRLDDVVTLENQDVYDRNGRYRVVGGREGEVELATALRLRYSDHAFDLSPKQLSQTREHVVRNTVAIVQPLEPLDRVYFEDLRRGGVVSDGEGPGLYAVVIIPDQGNDINEYHCATDPTLPTEQRCTASYEWDGTTPRVPGVWDKRCESNDECPFYRANVNYANDRGGCISGHCEMPLGVARRGYRQVDPETPPVCHRCKDAGTVYCCVEQKDRVAYPNLQGPDYAFADDALERINASLPVSA